MGINLRKSLCVVNIVIIFSFLTGCIATRSYHGYIFEKGQNAIKAEIGVDSRGSILGKYGEPTLKSKIDEHVWYYISERSSTKALARPEVNTRFITALRFDTTWKLAEIDKKTVDDALKIKVAKDTTSTAGRRLSIWEQMLGNIGQQPTALIGNQ